MFLRIETELPIRYVVGTQITPLNFSGDVILVFDQGKTNTALFIATPYREIIKVIQFGSKGRQHTASEFSNEFSDFLPKYLSKCNVIDVIIEQPTGDTQGMHYYRSSMVLTEIRARLLALSHYVWGINTKEVCNWSWKSAVLPKECRKRGEKGSAVFFRDWYLRYGTDDVTDALGILLYSWRTWYFDTQKPFPTKPVSNAPSYTWCIVAPSVHLPNFCYSEYNPDLTWNENLSWFAKNVYKPSCFLICKNRIPENEFNSHLSGGLSADEEIYSIVVMPQR